MELYFCGPFSRSHGSLHRCYILYCFSSSIQGEDAGCRQDAAACKESDKLIIKKKEDQNSYYFIQISGHCRLYYFYDDFLCLFTLFYEDVPDRRSFMAELFVAVDRSIIAILIVHWSLASITSTSIYLEWRPAHLYLAGER